MKTWHRPLLLTAAAMVVLTIVVLVAMLFDHREVTGVNLWMKPLKFSLSVGIYSLTLSWLITQVTRARRLAWAAGTVAAIGLLVEMVIIVGFAVIGETSHFNVTNALHTALWAVMAVSITVVWMVTLVIGIVLFRSRIGDPARTLAIRAGVVLALVGMALAFLMTGPTAAQLDNYQGIVGAHTVGLADGGPGLPVLGWSTVAGDLRIPHFIGIHALQVLPIVAILLELLRVSAARRFRLMWIATGAYAAVLVLVTMQAIAGESIVQPSGLTVVAASTILVVALGSAVAVLRVPSKETTRESAVR